MTKYLKLEHCWIFQQEFHNMITIMQKVDLTGRWKRVMEQKLGKEIRGPLFLTIKN